MSKTKALVYCSLFTALIAVGAFIRVPIPVLPFTLQYLFTMLAGLLLGPRLGTISTVAYMLLGLAGLPIFTEGGGLWYVFKPSFGYIIGFCGGTFVTNYVIASPIGLWPLILYCCILAIPGDIALSILAAIVVKRLQPVLGADLRPAARKA